MIDTPWELCELSTWFAVVERVDVKVEKFWGRFLELHISLPATRSQSQFRNCQAERNIMHQRQKTPCPPLLEFPQFYSYNLHWSDLVSRKSFESCRKLDAVYRSTQSER